jgi:hypothetical protein
METTTTETVPPRTGKPNGRPPFEPKENLCQKVELLAGLGLAHHKIALILCISPTTLRKHFRHQLKIGAAQARLNVLTSLFDMATKGRNASAAIFFAKTRCGFRTDGRPPAPHRVKNPSAHPANQGGF